MMYDGWMGWGGMWLGPLFMVGLLVLAVFVVVALIRAFAGNGAGSFRPRQSPRQILDERLARGEIDREEFDQRRKALDA